MSPNGSTTHACKELALLRVKHLYLCGYSARQISEELGINRNTTKRYLDKITPDILAELEKKFEDSRNKTFEMVQEAFRSTFKALVDDPEGRFFPAMSRVMIKMTGLDQPRQDNADLQEMVKQQVEAQLKTILEGMGMTNDANRTYTSGDTEKA